MRKSDFGEYDSGNSLMMAPCAARSSARAASRSAPGARRPNSSVMRCTRPVTIVASRWCGLVTTLAMISVSVGYGTDGSSTPMIVADRRPNRTVLPSSPVSPFSAVVQKRFVSTTTPSALGPSSVASIRRPSTGRSPMTEKYEPPTTPARTTRGSPSPIMVKSMVEKSPNVLTDFTRARRS
jgi:hypothetical protein